MERKMTVIIGDKTVEAHFRYQILDFNGFVSEPASPYDNIIRTFAYYNAEWVSNTNCQIIAYFPSVEQCGVDFRHPEVFERIVIWIHDQLCREGWNV